MSYPNIPPINYTPIQVPNHITRDNYVSYITKANNISSIINNGISGNSGNSGNNTK
jgi:hypothetical protein